MKKIVVIISSFFAVFFVAVSCNQDKETADVSEAGPISQDSLLKRGEYLVTILDCEICHSPKTMGPQGPQPVEALRFSGHPAKTQLGKIDTTMRGWMHIDPSFTAFAGAWGVSFAANISSDESGIGNWTEQQFFTAIRKGKFKGLEGGRELLPPMPWPAFSHMTDEDLRAIYTFLKSTKGVDNVVPAPLTPNQVNAK